MRDVLAERREERDRLLAEARAYVERLAAELPIVGAAVVGSIARGDFNVWSDVDIVVVGEGLPARAPERAACLVAFAPPRVQPVGFTPEEFRAARRKGNRLAVEATQDGVILAGEEFFREVAKGE